MGSECLDNRHVVLVIISYITFLVFNVVYIGLHEIVNRVTGVIAKQLDEERNYVTLENYNANVS